jgi:TetR/AcrR family transcriptional repressor of nem operon
MPRGAKKQFVRDDALADAMHLFWERTYESVGLAELLERMDIARQSLYDTFGSKETLFREALLRYADVELGPIRDQLAAPGSPLRNLRRAMDSLASRSLDGSGRGCLLVNSLAESPVLSDDLRTVLDRVASGLESAFHGALESARTSGELVADADTRALARSLMGYVSGVAVMGRSGAAKAVIKDVVRMQRRLIGTYESR